MGKSSVNILLPSISNLIIVEEVNINTHIEFGRISQ
jgi:hypothetical protein